MAHEASRAYGEERKRRVVALSRLRRFGRPRRSWRQGRLVPTPCFESGIRRVGDAHGHCAQAIGEPPFELESIGRHIAT
jgi:hypothetical protein